MGFYHLGSAWLWSKYKTRVTMLNSNHGKRWHVVNIWWWRVDKWINVKAAQWCFEAIKSSTSLLWKCLLFQTFQMLSVRMAQIMIVKQVILWGLWCSKWFYPPFSTDYCRFLFCYICCIWSDKNPQLPMGSGNGVNRWYFTVALLLILLRGHCRYCSQKYTCGPVSIFSQAPRKGARLWSQFHIVAKLCSYTVMWCAGV